MNNNYLQLQEEATRMLIDPSTGDILDSAAKENLQN